MQADKQLRKGVGDGRRRRNKPRIVSLVNEGKQEKRKDKTQRHRGGRRKEQSRAKTPIMRIKPERRTVQAQTGAKQTTTTTSRPRPRLAPAAGDEKKSEKHQEHLAPVCCNTSRWPDAQNAKLAACSVAPKALPCFATRPLCVGAGLDRALLHKLRPGDAPTASSWATTGGCRWLPTAVRGACLTR